MKRSRVLVSLAIVAAGGLTVAQFASVRHASSVPRAAGDGVQNGWVMDGAFDGTNSSSIFPPVPRVNDAFISFLHRALPFLAGDPNDCVVYTPSFIGLRLRVPDTISGFTFTGRMPDGKTFTMTGAESREWKGRGYQSEEYLALPPVPESCPWIDITVNDWQKVPITWRVSNLPKLVHHDFGPPTADTIALTNDGILAGRAWLSASGENFFGSGQFAGVDRVPVRVQLLLRNLPNAATPDLHWETDNPMMTEEWDVPPSTKVRYPESFTAQRLRNSDASTDTQFRGGAALFPEIQHMVQVRGTAEQHLCLRETLTFHNVPVEHRSDGWYLAPGTSGSVARSSNGVTVSLLPIAAEGYHGFRPEPTLTNAIRFRFGVSSENGSGLQSGTMLSERRHIPIAISKTAVSLAGGTADSFNRLDVDSNDYLMPNYFVGMVSPLEMTRPFARVDISIELYEDTVLSTVPYTFNLPVQPGTPTDVGPWIMNSRAGSGANDTLP